VPVLEWLVKLRKRDQPAYARCVAAVERLAAIGHELRPPLADLFRDGIYELRIRKGRVNYRILYFYHGPGLATNRPAPTNRIKLTRPCFWHGQNCCRNLYLLLP